MTDAEIVKAWDTAVALARDVRAEQSVLGGCLCKPTILDWLELEPEAFWDARHGQVWLAMQALARRRVPIDEVTLAAELRDRGRLQMVGGEMYLAELSLRVPTVDNVVAYAETLRGHLVTRRLLALASSLPSKVRDGTSGEQLLDDVTLSLAEIEPGKRDGGASISELVQREVRAAVEFADRVAKGSGELVGIPTGIDPIDTRTGGLPVGVPTILGARPGNGKSTLGLCIGMRAARRDLAVHVVTYEDRGPAWAQRTISQETDIPVTRIASRSFGRQDLTAMVFAAEAVRPVTRLWVDHGHGLSADRLVRLVRARKREIGTKLLVLDYLQLIPPMSHERGWKRHEQLTSVLNLLTELIALEGIAGLILSQLNRDADAEERRPRLSDFKACGAIEEVGKLIMALHPARIDNEIEVLILKNSQGPTAQVIARWDRQRCWIG